MQEALNVLVFQEPPIAYKIINCEPALIPPININMCLSDEHFREHSFICFHLQIYGGKLSNNINVGLQV